MEKKSVSSTKIYDPESGKAYQLDHLITRLGIQAICQKYGVSESTVYKWKRGLHRPSLNTLSKSSRKLF